MKNIGYLTITLVLTTAVLAGCGCTNQKTGSTSAPTVLPTNEESWTSTSAATGESSMPSAGSETSTGGTGSSGTGGSSEGSGNTGSTGSNGGGAGSAAGSTTSATDATVDNGNGPIVDGTTENTTARSGMSGNHIG